MTQLDELRAGLTETQITILNTIWDYELELNRDIPSIALSATNWASRKLMSSQLLRRWVGTLLLQQDLANRADDSELHSWVIF